MKDRNDQIRDGEVSLRLRCLETSLNSFEATSQGREICRCHRDLDSDSNVESRERGDIGSDGGIHIVQLKFSRPERF